MSRLSKIFILLAAAILISPQVTVFARLNSDGCIESETYNRCKGDQKKVHWMKMGPDDHRNSFLQKYLPGVNLVPLDKSNLQQQQSWTRANKPDCGYKTEHTCKGFHQQGGTVTEDYFVFTDFEGDNKAGYVYWADRTSGRIEAEIEVKPSGHMNALHYKIGSKKIFVQNGKGTTYENHCYDFSNIGATDNDNSQNGSNGGHNSGSSGSSGSSGGSGNEEKKKRANGVKEVDADSCASAPEDADGNLITNEDLPVPFFTGQGFTIFDNPVRKYYFRAAWDAGDTDHTERDGSVGKWQRYYQQKDTNAIFVFSLEFQLHAIYYYKAPKGESEDISTDESGNIFILINHGPKKGCAFYKIDRKALDLKDDIDNESDDDEGHYNNTGINVPNDQTDNDDGSGDPKPPISPSNGGGSDADSENNVTSSSRGTGQ